MGIVSWIVYGFILIFYIACLWIVYQKAGKAGWGAFVPIYNIVMLCDIGGQSRWWTIGYFIPIINIVAGLIVSIGVAINFDRSVAFGVGLFLLSIIFYPILAFGDSRYYTHRVPSY